MPERTLIQEDEEEARRIDAQRPGTAGGTLPGDTEEGAQPGDTIAASAAPVDPEQRMAELEARRGEGAPGTLGQGDHIGTPAGMPLRGVEDRSGGGDDVRTRGVRGQQKDRQPRNNVEN